MAMLYGKTYTRDELLQYASDAAQLGGVRLLTLDDGAARGLRLAQFRTGSGLAFDVLLDRGMMGDGVADLKAIRAGVEAAGYAGPCEVEVFSARDWWCRDPNEVLDTMIARFRTVC